MFTRVLGGYVASTVLLVPKTVFITFVRIQTFRRALTVSVDSGAEIQSAPSRAEFEGRCRKEMI